MRTVCCCICSVELTTTLPWTVQETHQQEVRQLSQAIKAEVRQAYARCLQREEEHDAQIAQYRGLVVELRAELDAQSTQASRGILSAFLSSPKPLTPNSKAKSSNEVVASPEDYKQRKLRLQKERLEDEQSSYRIELMVWFSHV